MPCIGARLRSHSFGGSENRTAKARRPDLAEAGGKNPEALDSALAEVYTVVNTLLEN